MSFFRITRSSLFAKYAAITLVLAGLLALSGCWVTSINGLYEEPSTDNPHTDPDLVFDPSLIGSWIEAGDKCTAPLTITHKDEVYDLRSTGEGEGCTASDKARYQAHLVRLDTYYFLDVSPMADDVCNMCLAKHSIFLVRIDKAALSVTPIDSDWLKKSLAAKTVVLAALAGDTDTITASPKDLKAFCRNFAENKEVFKPESTTTYKRK
jgi:hypothetical protein